MSDAPDDDERDERHRHIEFVGVTLLLLLPLLYLLLSVFSVQRAAFAVTQAAREAGRAYSTAPTSAAGSSGRSTPPGWRCTTRASTTAPPSASPRRARRCGVVGRRRRGVAAARRPVRRLRAQRRHRCRPAGCAIPVNGQFTVAVDAFRRRPMTAPWQNGRARPGGGQHPRPDPRLRGGAARPGPVVVDASAVFLARRSLANACDGASLSAAQSVDTGRVYRDGVAGSSLPLAGVQAAVGRYQAETYPAGRARRQRARRRHRRGRPGAAPSTCP